MKRMGKGWTLIMISLILLLVGCVAFIAHEFLYDKGQRDAFRELSARAAVEVKSPGGTTTSHGDLDRNKTAASTFLAETNQIDTIPQHDLKALQAENPDCIGWLAMPATGIDYPVMQNPDSAEYYLHRSFVAAGSTHGTPFLDARCGLDSANLYVYGHNMRDGSMFAPLLYAQQGTQVLFETAGGDRVYEVVAVLDAREGNDAFFGYVSSHDDTGFTAFTAAVNINISTDDRLLTLITCDDSIYQDGRRLVVCRETERRPA